jgi:hypothetical protein
MDYSTLRTGSCKANRRISLQNRTGVPQKRGLQNSVFSLSLYPFEQEEAVVDKNLSTPNDKPPLSQRTLLFIIATSAKSPLKVFIYIRK